MRRLLFAVAYCVLSLFIADLTSSLFLHIGVIAADDVDAIFNMVMLSLFVMYIVISMAGLIRKP